MANTKSALKRVRQNETRNARNTDIKSRLKTLRKKTLAAAEAGDKEATAKAFQKFTSVVDKCTKKNVIHKNKAANLKSKTAIAIAKSA
jgi:small subunit ribosomal protein S20